MRRLFRPLLPSVALAGALLAGALPVSAGQLTSPRTWYVAPPAPTITQAVGGSCLTPDILGIGNAIDASGPGDTIIVCDGIYDEGFLSLDGHDHDGLTIRAQNQWAATLRAPYEGSGGTMLEIADADGVTITGLRFRGRNACGSGVGTVILVRDARDVDLRANRFAGGKDSVASGCGFAYAVQTEQTTGRIRYNLVTDWTYWGIFAASADTDGGRLRITENALRFNHRGVHGQGAGSRGGIVVYAQATGYRTVVQGNVITVAKSGGLGATDTPTLRSGIGWEADRVTVRGNTVRNTELGISGFGGGSVFVEDNVARGITYDCYNQGPSDGWSNNDGRGWKSAPVGLCTKGG